MSGFISDDIEEMTRRELGSIAESIRQNREEKEQDGLRESSGVAAVRPIAGLGSGRGSAEATKKEIFGGGLTVDNIRQIREGSAAIGDLLGIPTSGTVIDNIANVLDVISSGHFPLPGGSIKTPSNVNISDLLAPAVLPPLRAHC